MWKTTDGTPVFRILDQYKPRITAQSTQRSSFPPFLFNFSAEEERTVEKEEEEEEQSESI